MLLFRTAAVAGGQRTGGAGRDAALRADTYPVAVSVFRALVAAHRLRRVGAALCAFVAADAALFGLSGTGAAALALGLCGGYPVGARTAAELVENGALSRDEGERLLAFCNNAGPGFLLGVCGAGVFSSSRAGAALYLIHVAAALCAGLLICRALPPVPHGTYPHKSAKAQHLSTAFPAAVQNALTGCLNVSAFVVFFTVLARLLLHFLPQAFASSLPCALLLGFLELTSGVLSLSCSRAGFLSCAALLGWGGLSVHCQTLSVLAATPLSARYYLKGKVLQALLSLLLALPALPFLFP